MNKKKFKTVSLPAREYELAEQLAKKQMRSLSNYLQVLINKEYEAVKIIVVLALLLFASCTKEQVEPNYDCAECTIVVSQRLVGLTDEFSLFDTSYETICEDSLFNKTYFQLFDRNGHQFERKTEYRCIQ